MSATIEGIGRQENHQARILIVWALRFLLLSFSATAAVMAYMMVFRWNRSSASTIDYLGDLLEGLKILLPLIYLTIALYWLVVKLIKQNWLLPALWVGKDRKPDHIISIDERRLLKPQEQTLADRLEVINGIHRRVERLVVRSQVILYTIGIALFASAIIILFAGRLTSVDASAVSNVDRLKSDLSDETRKLARLYLLKSDYTQLGIPDLAKEQVDKLNRQISALRDDSFSSDSTPTPIDLPSTEARLADQKDRVDKLSTLLQKAWEKELGSERGYSDWHYIAATAITRIGIVLIIVYLVQILMGLYRYNTRLVAYYNSRRDLLTLWDGKQRTLKALDAVLSSSKIDFGKEPKHPLEDFFRAFGGKLDAAISGKRTSKRATKSQAEALE